jgi:hypothetical protein
MSQITEKKETYKCKACGAKSDKPQKCCGTAMEKK